MMDARSAFIYGYYIAAVGALKATGFETTEVASLGWKIRQNAAEVWDYLSESDEDLATRLANAETKR